MPAPVSVPGQRASPESESFRTTKSGKSYETCEANRGSQRQPKYFLTLTTMYNTVYAIHYMTHSDRAVNTFENLRLELRRGCLVLAVLASLRTEQYGYTLRKILAENGMAINQGTLYPR